MAHKITFSPALDEPVRWFGPIQEKVLTTGDFRDTLRARWETPPPLPTERGFTMGRVIRPVAKNGPSIVAVPDDVAEDLEGIFAHLADNPHEVAFAEFDTVDELKAFGKQAKSWAQTRDGGAVEYRQLRSADLAENQIKFVVRIPASEEVKAAARAKRKGQEAKREAKAAAEAKAGARK